VDVEAARAAGMGAVAVTWGAGEPALLSAAAPDSVVDDMAGLRGVLLPPPHP
jgi:pyrophosphatase PpaX